MDINNTTPLPRIQFFRYLNKDAFVISVGVFAAVAILANLFLMIIILSSSKLRSSPQHIIIFALCLADLFTGAFEYPLLTEYYYLEKWIHDCKLFQILEYDLFYILTSIKCFLVISLGADFVFLVLSLNKKRRTIIAFLMICGSVGLSIAILLPLVLRYVNSGTVDEDCFYTFMGPTDQTVNYLVTFPQIIGIILMIVLVTILHFCYPKRSERNGPCDVILAGETVLLYMPIHLWILFYQGCSDCWDLWVPRGVLMLIYCLPPCLLPFVWFLNSLTRKGVRQVCCCNSYVHDDTGDVNRYTPASNGIKSTRM